MESEIRKVYTFLNTCRHCHKAIQFPLIGDFAYGEMIFQTEDAEEFYLAILIDNPTFKFINDFIENNSDHKIRDLDSQKVLALVADKINGKRFSPDYPICPNCKRIQKDFDNKVSMESYEIELVTWNKFESLSKGNKELLIKNIASKPV